MKFRKILPEKPAPVWSDTPKDPKTGLPPRPDAVKTPEPPAPTHYEVGAAAVEKPQLLPNKRGSGGRPTKGELAAEHRADAATQAVHNVREANPPRFPLAHRRTWEREYNERELTVEQEEAEMALRQRQDILQAKEHELLVRQSNRKLALGASTAGLRAVALTQKLVVELTSRDTTKMSTDSIQKTLRATATVMSTAQNMLARMADLERDLDRNPIDGGASEQPDNPDSDLDNMTPEMALVALKNFRRIIGGNKPFAGAPVDVDAEEGEDDGGA